MISMEVVETDLNEERFYTIPEVARVLRVSDQSVRRWIKAGALRATKPGKEYRIGRSDLEEFLRTREARPKAESRSSLELTFNDVLEEERRLRYLRVIERFATAMNGRWTARLERGDFSEEVFQYGCDTLLDLDTAFTTGVGTDLLGALRTGEITLPEAERDALNNAKASIDALNRSLWRVSDTLKARGAANVTQLDAYRKLLEETQARAWSAEA